MVGPVSRFVFESLESFYGSVTDVILLVLFGSKVAASLLFLKLVPSLVSNFALDLLRFGYYLGKLGKGA